MVWPLLRKAYTGYCEVGAAVSSRFPIGTNVYEWDWDVLILLDTCRVDALAEVSGEYDWLPDEIESIWSVGSTSPEWIANTFTPTYRDEIADTVYVTTNGHPKRVFDYDMYAENHYGAEGYLSNWETVDSNDFLLCEESFKYLEPHKYSRFNPRGLSDRAIYHQRDLEPDRLIVHYIQPHSPFCRATFEEDRPLEPWEEDPFGYLRDGGDKSRVWQAYLNELRWILDEVDFLRGHLEGNMVISADHGECFGELGVLYGHGLAIPHPAVKKVPWVQIPTRGPSEYSPNVDNSLSDETMSAEEHLENLGYL